LMSAFQRASTDLISPTMRAVSALEIGAATA